MAGCGGTSRWCASVLVCTAAFTFLGLSVSGAQTAKEFYTGKQIDIIVGTATGTGYDTYARLFARYMPKYIPGEPKIVVKNMPGAGGIVAANQVAVSAPRDGSVLCLPLREAVLDPLLSGSSSSARYDPRELVWIGTPTQEIGMIYVSTASGVKTIEDAMSREVLVAAGGATSGPAVFSRLLNAVIGTKFKPILGYVGTSDAMVAIERGEAEGRVTSGWGGPETVTVHDWISKGKARLLLQIGVNKSPDYPNLPHVMDFAKSADDRKVLEFLFAGQAFGRPLFAPPGIPADRAAVLKDAFNKVMNDPDLKAEALKSQLGHSPLTGDEMKALIDGVYSTRTDLKNRGIEIYRTASQG
jgi:tripartite-type tricarboxylate transporter receptor subunit TctC